MWPPATGRGCSPRRRRCAAGWEAWSALGRAEREAGDELALQEDEDEDRRNGRQQRPGGYQVVVDEELALHVVQGGRDRSLVARLHQEEGPEEVVVHEGEQQ